MPRAGCHASAAVAVGGGMFFAVCLLLYVGRQEMLAEMETLPRFSGVFLNPRCFVVSSETQTGGLRIGLWNMVPALPQAVGV